MHSLIRIAALAKIINGCGHGDPKPKQLLRHTLEESIFKQYCSFNGFRPKHKWSGDDVKLHTTVVRLQWQDAKSTARVVIPYTSFKAICGTDVPCVTTIAKNSFQALH